MTGSVLPDKLFKKLAELPHVANELKSRRIKEAHWLPIADMQLLQPPRTFVEQVSLRGLRPDRPCISAFRVSALSVPSALPSASLTSVRTD